MVSQVSLSLSLSLLLSSPSFVPLGNLPLHQRQAVRASALDSLDTRNRLVVLGRQQTVASHARRRTARQKLGGVSPTGSPTAPVPPAIYGLYPTSTSSQLRNNNNAVRIRISCARALRKITC